MQTKINKAVFPLAGIGAAALSAGGRKSEPSLAGKPLLQYAIDEVLAAVGRYVLTPSVFQHPRWLKDAGCRKGTLNHAPALLRKAERVTACQFEGIRNDWGSTLGALQATVQFGLRHPAVCNEFRAFLRTLPFIDSAPTLHLAAARPQTNQAIAIAG